MLHPREACIGVPAPAVDRNDVQSAQTHAGRQHYRHLWYVDEVTLEATFPDQPDTTLEYFHWQRDINGKERVGEVSSRSVFVFQVVHITCLKSNTAGHPVAALVGQFFSSFHTIHHMLGMNSCGWDDWHARGHSGETMRALVKRNGKLRHVFLNPHELKQPFQYDGMALHTRCRDPRIPPRDLLINLCVHECSQVCCEPWSAARLEEFVGIYGSQPRNMLCPHGHHYFLDDLPLVSLKDEACRNLMQQMEDVGRISRFDDVKLNEWIEVFKSHLAHPYWTMPLLAVLSDLQRVAFPGSVPLRQRFTRSLNDQLFLNDVDAVRALNNYYTCEDYGKTLSQLSPSLYVADGASTDDVVVLTKWGLDQPQHHQLIDKAGQRRVNTWRVVYVPIKLSVLREAFHNAPDETWQTLNAAMATSAQKKHEIDILALESKWNIPVEKAKHAATQEQDFPRIPSSDYKKDWVEAIRLFRYCAEDNMDVLCHPMTIKEYETDTLAYSSSILNKGCRSFDDLHSAISGQHKSKKKRRNEKTQ